MKVKRFNQLNETATGYEPNQKVLEVTFKGKLYASLNEVENTDAYWQNIEEYGNDVDTSRFYALEQYIYEAGDLANHFDYKLVDGNGIEIKDEEIFDNSKKYNV